ncbi:MAG: serine/threonine protein phosphatase [Chloroflexi bacterium]|nr:serine/threonine protein phosphatase [Chloroflexota bacterium]
MSQPFTFALIADSHIRADDETPSNEYPSNQTVNRRNRAVIQAINRLAPDFVIHLGDLAHPIPALPAHEKAMKQARTWFRELTAPFYVTPGNHDIGDKPRAWVPAPEVSAQALARFRRVWGPSPHAFTHKGCRFVLLNAPILNSDLSEASDQRRWLERELARSGERDLRIFLFLHYPPYLVHPDEPEHYDNLGQPARGWLLALLKQYQVEALFAGHVHNFFYNRHGKTHLYALPSVAFVRPAYSELFRIAPAAEYGRADMEKLGFGLVIVDEEGARLQLIRVREADVAPAFAAPRLADGLGVFLRQGWADAVTLPYGNLDEFRRKRARNDYLLWALWDLGIEKLRVPVDDLADATSRDRMEDVAALGFRFLCFSAGLPTSEMANLCRANERLLAGWEIILPTALMERAANALDRLDWPIPCYLSRLDSLADQQLSPDAAEIDHFPRHGFPLDASLDAIPRALLDAVTGLVFRVEPHIDPAAGVENALKRASALGKEAIVHVWLPRAGEGTAFTDDEAIARRVAAARSAAHAHPRVSVYLDALVDHDRGYHPRHGLLDRRYNLRFAALDSL